MADSSLSPQDLDLATRTVLSEAGTDGDPGMAAVANVIKNRVASGQYGATPSAVVTAPGQFSAWSLPKNDPNNPSRVSTQNPQYQRAAQIVNSVFTNQLPDNTGGADHYLNPSLVKTMPGWAQGQPTAKVGSQSFYASATMTAAPSDDDLMKELQGHPQQIAAPSSNVSTPNVASDDDLVKELSGTQPVTFADRFTGEQPPQAGSITRFVQGLEHGAASTFGNFVSAMSPAAAGEAVLGGVSPDYAKQMPMTPQQGTGVIQTQLTGPLTQGTGFAGRFGENVGGAIPYMATMPAGEGPISAATNLALQSGLTGFGTTAGQALTKGTALEPYGGLIGGVLAPTAIPALTGAVGRGVGGVLSGLNAANTGVAPSNFTKAFAAGAQGGDAGAAFRASAAGDVSPGDLVQQAKGALTNMRSARQQQYMSSMDTVRENATPLSFNDIDAALDKANNIKVFRGQSGTAAPQNLSPQTQGVQDEVNAAVNNWKSLDPAEYHTPIGMDALKQQVGAIKDNLPYGTPQRKVAEDAYSAIRGTIVKQAPQYAGAMSDYEDASNQLSEIQKTLSLNPKATVDTAFRKLMSSTRNNVNTNYGQRANLVSQLEQNGAPNLSSSLAGQALSSWVPRGLSGGVASAELLPLAWGAYQYGGLPALASLGATLPLRSPRLAGTVAHGLGRLYGSVAPQVQGTPVAARALFSSMVPRLAAQ